MKIARKRKRKINFGWNFTTRTKNSLGEKTFMTMEKSSPLSCMIPFLQFVIKVYWTKSKSVSPKVGEKARLVKLREINILMKVFEVHEVQLNQGFF